MKASLNNQPGTSPPQRLPVTPAPSGLIQRKCACGGAASTAGDCDACNKKRLAIQRFPADRASSSIIQPLAATPSHFGHHIGRVRVHNHLPQGVQAKLNISQPADQYELEADRIAEHFTRVSSGLVSTDEPRPLLSSSDHMIQRLPIDEEASRPETDAAPTDELASTQPDQAPSPGLIAEDDAPDLSPGQMRKSAFLDQLRSSVCSTADAVLSTVGRSAQGCPYIEGWIGYYRTRSGQQIERAIRKFAPEAGEATSASDYIALINDRIRRGVLVWATTGEITGVPEELLTASPGAGVSASSASSGSEPTAISFKAREGGAVAADDPQAIRSQLGPGQSLDGGVKARMEAALGHNFSNVRVHNDASAARLSASLNARAFTIGSDIAFGSDEYKPGTPVGDAIIAHELAHVMQQDSADTSSGPLKKGAGEYDALEEDADNSAVGAMVSMWGGAKGALADMARNAMPRLKSGLRLSRCKGGKEKEAEKKAPPAEAGGSKQAPKSAPTSVADIVCSPKPETYDNIISIPGIRPGTLGYTKASAISLELSMGFESGKCKPAFVSEPKLAFDYFVYTKPGTYRVGTAEAGDGPCRGKTLELFLKFTPEMSEVIKQGEIEHCEDEKRAFALSYERYVNAIRELADTPAADQQACEAAIAPTLSAKTGVEISKLKPVADCLFDKTLERDKTWHKADLQTGAMEFDRDCKTLIITLDPTKTLTEVGKHSSAEVVKGCGEK